ncbi:MAG TPA: hypothetical protein VFX20_03425 [Steroidobacteraceae bacterium]|nr:hypothetical protein [Steroidobacteraceae bacterium]
MANTLIHESRRLQFPLDTLVDALIELENKQGHWPPKATVVGASIDNSGESDSNVILSIHRAEGGDVIERRYGLSKLAAAMVNYCLTMRVPIPRNSTKSIQLLRDGVALVLENTVMLQSKHEELSTLPAGSVQTAAPAADEDVEADISPAAETPPAAEASAAAETPADTQAAAPDGSPPAAQASPDVEHLRAGDSEPTE